MPVVWSASESLFLERQQKADVSCTVSGISWAWNFSGVTVIGWVELNNEPSFVHKINSVKNKASPKVNRVALNNSSMRLIFRRKCCCIFAHFYTFFHSMVCLLSVCLSVHSCALLKAFNWLRCHLAGTTVGGSNVSDGVANPEGYGRLTVKTCNCKMQPKCQPSLCCHLMNTNKWFLSVSKFITLKMCAPMIIRLHSFPQAAEFRAEPWNLPFSAEFWYCLGISQNFTEIKKWPMISMIVGFKLTISRRKIKLNCLKLRPY